MLWRSTARRPPPSSPAWRRLQQQQQNQNGRWSTPPRLSKRRSSRGNGSSSRAPRSGPRRSAKNGASDFDGGKYAKLAPAFCKSGKTLAVIYRGDLLRQVEALGGSEADCEVLYMAFRKLVKDAKKKPVKRSAVALKMARDAQLLKANKERATASIGSAARDRTNCKQAEKHEGSNLG